MRKYFFSAVLLLSLGLTTKISVGQSAYPHEDQVIQTLKANPYLAITKWESSSLSVAPSAKTVVNMVFVVENGSSWSDANVFQNEMLKVQNIFNVCHVAIGEILKVYTNIPPQTDAILKHPDPYVGPTELVIAEKGLPLQDPIGFLFKKRLSGTAVAYNEMSIENENHNGGESWDSLRNTLWMTDNFIPYSVTPNALPGFSMLAHEITHLIGNLGHLPSGPANLMQVSDNPHSINGDLNASQCEAIHAFSRHN